MSEKNLEVLIRLMQITDIPNFLEIEKRLYSYKDEDFDTDTLPDWAFDEKSLVEFAGRYKNPDKGLYETRLYICETPANLKDKKTNCLIADNWAIGGFGYELMPDSFDLSFLDVDPTIPYESVAKAVFDHLILRTTESEARKIIKIHIRDYGNFGPHIQSWKNLGLSFKLRSNFYGDMDCWEAIHKVER